jgi:hypothetical protein
MKLLKNEIEVVNILKYYDLKVNLTPEVTGSL